MLHKLKVTIPIYFIIGLHYGTLLKILYAINIVGIILKSIGRNIERKSLRTFKNFETRMRSVEF